MVQCNQFLTEPHTLERLECATNGEDSLDLRALAAKLRGQGENKLPI